MELEKKESVTVLDEYDCADLLDRIRVRIDSPRDPSLSDIMSELYNSDGLVYFDGKYYNYNGEYVVAVNERGWFLDLFY